MKHKWKKNERELYGAKCEPQMVVVPQQNFIMINGVGNPNNEDFSERVGVLYSLAYPIKMRFKAMCNKDEAQRAQHAYSDYAVYPLEGWWTSSNAANPLDKDCFRYTVMIRQPGCITKEQFEVALEQTAKKKPHPLLKEILFDTMEDGKCVQMLHIGPFEDEPASFAKMDAFAKDSGLARLNQYHREIYLGDARKTAPEKRQTILRFQVK